MDTFKPIAGSIASVAVIDDLFDDFRWVFGQYEISNDFGDNASEYWLRYKGQVVQFEQFRDTIFQSIDHPLNDNQTRLESGLREQLRAWIRVLQDCDDLIAYCEDVELTDTHSVAATSRAPSTSYSAHRPSTRSSDAAQHKRPSCGSTAALRPNFLHRILNKFSRRRRNAPERDSITQQPSIAVERWLDGREKFIELLRVLQGHTLSISRRVVLKKPESAATDILKTQRVESELIRYRSGGDRLQQLIQCLRTTPRPSQMAFHLLLQSDPFDFRSKLCGNSQICDKHFQDGSAAFYLRLSIGNSQSITADVESPSSPMDFDYKQRFFVFGVSYEDSEVLPDTEILDLQRLFEPRTIDPGCTDWAIFHGHFGKKIRIISDCTPHSRQRSFFECITNAQEKRQLRKPGYASMRAKLAFVVASSLFYKLHAEGSHDVEGAHMFYHTTLNARRQEPDVAQSRILPYIPLDTIGATAGQPSSFDALTSSTDSDLEERMMKNLGVLIYEIGSWTRVAGTDLQDRVTIVEDAKEHLREDVATKYRDVVHECLSYKQSEDTEKWMIQEVIVPLKDVYEKLRDTRFLAQ